ncbi:MAG: ATP-binding protein [Cyanobacteria bacterium P01_D01_bin.105]
MRITTKFIGSSAVLIGLVSLLSGISYVMNRRTIQSLDISYEQSQRTVSAVVEVERSLQEQVTALSRLAVLNPQINQNTDGWVNFRQSRIAFFNALRELETILPAEDELAQIQVKSIRDQHAYLDTLASRIQTQLTSTEQAQGIARSLALFEDSVDVFIIDLLATAENQAEDYSHQQQIFYQRIFWLEALSFGVVVMLLALQFYYLLRPLTKSIQSLEAGANQIGRAENASTADDMAMLDMPKIRLDTGDELQALAGAFNHMGDRLTRLYQELEQRVAERTASLHKANQTLMTEVGDRIEAEACLQTALDELKRTQLQLLQTEKMSSLGQLVAGVAHEINNPVSFIEGNLQPAQDYVDSMLALLRRYKAEYPEASDELLAAIEAADLDFIKDDFPQLLQSMKNGADRITTIVRSLRTFSHLDESETKSTDINADLDNVLLLLSSQLNGSKPSAHHAQPITVIRHYSDLPKVYCYPGQINQVWMGLITNAIEAMTAPTACQQPTLTLTTEALPTFVRVRITDNGIGMSATVKQHIFDPFFTTKPVGSGTGLGLAMSYQIVVNNHQGQLTCESTPQVGTTFTIEIPLTLQLQNFPEPSDLDMPSVFANVV